MKPDPSNEQLGDETAETLPKFIPLDKLWKGRRGGPIRRSRTISLPARILAMCKKRGWSMTWSARGAYLHLKASEFIEALRGKRGDPKCEAADVLLVLMSMTEHNGIPWSDVVAQTAATCAKLETMGPYAGEDSTLN